MKRLALPATAGLALLLAGAAPARAETLWIEAATVLPVDGSPIEGGRLVVEDGVVKAVGASLVRPRFSRLVDARDQVVTPGFVVPVSHVGLPSPPARRGPRKGVEVGTDASPTGADELYVLRPEYALLRRLGITTIGLAPRSPNPGIQGRVSAVSTGPGLAEDVTLEKGAALLVRVAAHGPWREKVGDALEKADAERRKKKKKTKDPLARSLAGELPVLVQPDDGAGWVAARDVLPLESMEASVLDGFRLHELAEEMKAAGVRVITWPTLVRQRRSRIPLNRSALYERLGIPVAFRLPSDDVEGAMRLRDAAIEMARTGTSRETTLAALTLEPARALGLEEKVGSIAKGRRADLLFWSGDPLEPVSRLERVMIAGELFDPETGAASRDEPAGDDA